MDSMLRNQYYQIPIGEEGDKDPVWIKKLKLILDADIHSKPLGCKIIDTHIRIGEVHMGAFYEAQILFSHARWIRKFSEWLNYKIQEELEEKQNIKNIVIIGYETYIEPVLYTLKQRLQENTNCSVYYGIYEEPKFIQNKAGSKTEVRIRYIEDILSIRSYKHTQVFFVCGISSTLSTLKKMKDLFWNEYVRKSYKNSKFYTLIQVLPSKKDNIYQMSWNKEENRNIATSDRNKISAQYLVSVVCDWYEAETCPFCFPDNPIDEKPIIQTSETSIVPIQMITSFPREKNNAIYLKPELQLEKFDFFVKRRGEFKYKEYLYYNHIDRMDHHYKYYIRTGHLFKKILNDEVDKKKFKMWCEKIQKELEAENNAVNIIISPSHFSDEVFPNAINSYVFNGKAHMISFDPKKEFRSNFETKYSNIAYFIRQIKNSKEPVNIRFYYVDDQMVSGDMFYRVKSLVKSLMSENYMLSKNIEVFDAVIIFLSRISDSSKMDYVKDKKRYYSFADIEISSIRNYGDSCPICKLKHDSAVYTKASSLDVCAKHWSNKYWYHSTKSLEEVKGMHRARSLKENEILLNRHFRRMECENILYEKTKLCFSKEEFIDKIINAIYEKKDRRGNVPCEYLISFIKAIAVPFLYYKENEKKAAMNILLNIITQFKENDIADSLYLFEISKQALTVKFDNEYEKYSLLAVLINCLAEIDSTYLLNSQRIKELCDIVGQIKKDLLSFERVDLAGNVVEGFYNVVVNACKRVICGISGESKIKHMDMELERVLENSIQEEGLESLWRVLYLENANKSISLSDMEVEYKKKVDLPDMREKLEEDICHIKESATVEEYAYISDMLKVISGQDDAAVHFLYYDNTLEAKWFHLHIDGYDRIGDVCLNQIDILKEIPKEGVGWNRNECILRLHYYDIEGIMGLKNNTNAVEDEVYGKKIEKDVFLYIKFDNSIGKEELRAIRNILQYRYELCKKIDKDISTDAIKVAIQAKASEDLLKSDKAISHGAEEELSLLIKQAASLIDSYYFQRKEGGEENKEASLFLDACNGINIFMNRCIGYSNTHQIIQQYFTPQKPSLNARSRQSPFYNSIQNTQSIEWKAGWDFFVQYLKELGTNNSQYLRGLSKKRKDISTITITTNPSIDEFANYILQADAVPFFLNAGGAEAQYSMVFIIGILDVFVRNAIKHGVVKNGELTIKFEIISNNELEPVKYKIQVSNAAKFGKENTGITKKFFDVINKEKMPNADNFFDVGFTLNKADEEWKHVATLDIIKCFSGSENDF